MKLEDALILHKKFEGQTQTIEVVELYNAVLNTPAGVVVEVGSASGGTTIILIAAAQEVGKKVISVDPYPENIEGEALFYDKGLMKNFKEAFSKNILTGEYDVIQYNQDLSECIDKIPELSVAFIDGCHEFSFAAKEFNLLLPKMVAGGIIYFHDINWDRGQIKGDEDQALNKILKYLDGEIIGNMLKIVI